MNNPNMTIEDYNKILDDMKPKDYYKLMMGSWENKDKIKVVLSGLIFPLTMMGYIWRAFERRKDVELFVTGPFFDDYIPWSGGIRLPREYVKQPNYPLPQSAAHIRLPANFIESQLPWKPDLWLQIDAGWHLITKPNAGVVGLLETDPHVLKEHYRFPKSYSDLVWCMQTPYMETGEIYLPYGYDPEYHKPLTLEKQYDACLIGLHYEQRDRWVANLRKHGLNVYYSIGEIYDKYQEKYCQSKVALSWSSMKDLPARVWEGMAMNLPVVTNRVPDLSVNGFIDGVHYLGFDTIEEAEKQVMKLLVNDDLYRHINENGYYGVHEKGGNSWDVRVSSILKDCRLI